jgi:carboxymethylenebutenolidase
MPSFQARFHDIPVQDGSVMPAFFACPLNKPAAPAVIVFQEIFGVNHHIQNVALRLAEAGFAAISPELFHRSAKGLELAYDQVEKGREEQAKLSAANLEADMRATFSWLGKRPECDAQAVGAIGFCFGGNVAFQANAILPLKAAVSYYGGGIAQDQLPKAAKQHGPLLLFWAGKDQYIPLEQREAVEKALRAAGKDFASMEVSYADHGYHCDERGSYHPLAARESWAFTVEFLKNRLENRG